MRFLIKYRLLLMALVGIVSGVAGTHLFRKGVEATSTDNFCEICHVHPHVFGSWKLSGHYATASGVRVGCVECHLPPEGQGYLKEKIRLGVKDIWGFAFKDSASFNWEGRRTVETAQHFTYQESCVKCHVNLFPLTLTRDGQDAHLYYTQKEEELLCLNCHIDVGHYDPARLHTRNTGFGKGTGGSDSLFSRPARVDAFASFTETIPNTAVSFRMIAIPGGSYDQGSPEKEPFRKADEGPVRKVKISPFFMAETEVTWDEYLVFYAATAGEGRSTDTEGSRNLTGLDAITGPTPPYGQPDQNWGMGSRPAITMSFHAAETYCRWLSEVTGKHYRLPTEAEWEYAARGGTGSPYFFPGNPGDFMGRGIIGRFLGKNSEILDRYVIHQGNSMARTQPPDVVEANAFGLKNMLGNAAEYCADWYAPDAYSLTSGAVTNPRGPDTGSERVIRGGTFKSDAGNVRCASRDFTRSGEWLKTDPQIPKSLWWLSDCNHVSFRVVCDFDEYTGNDETATVESYVP